MDGYNYCRCPRCEKIERDAEEYHANSKKSKYNQNLICDTCGQEKRCRMFESTDEYFFICEDCDKNE